MIWLTNTACRKRERYDSGVDLADPADMFGGGGMGNIDPEIIFSMMGGGGPFGGGGMGGGMGGGFPGGGGFGFDQRGRGRGGFSQSFHYS